ncbi:sigma-70 family RNA polymerase sigma factor [Nocardia paucivorans]|uniref:sigma-70 family RNA polymerase sigma factor n=1 Tax=Nocardia paucivorans TaxID=114259 RepID=UPI001FDEFE52|nr:sigma-70 family RNA polymerase sigma factor [Nocardia paucivorans]
MSDEQVTALALAAAAGDRDALEEFVRRTQHEVWRFVAHLTDVQSADDLAQETFLRALGSLPRFAGRSSARVWLLSIARRTVVDRIRTAATRPTIVRRGDWQTEMDRRREEMRSDIGEEVAIGQLLRRLPDDRREAFVLTQILGLSYAEAAEAADCPIGTVRSRVARARETLVELWQEAEHRAEVIRVLPRVDAALPVAR